MTEAYLSIDNLGEIFYRRAGNGPVIMLLHGFPYDGTLWDEVVPSLSSRFTVVTPDLPGAGSSRLQKKDISMEDFGDAMSRLILHLSPDQPITVIGHSMGGYVALSLAEAHAELLNGLSLVHSSATPDSEEKKEQRRKAIALIEKGGKEEFFKAMVQGLFSPATKSEKQHLVLRTNQKASELPAQSAVSFYTAMMQRPDRTGVIKELHFPVQWILGREDSIIPLQPTLQQSVLSDTNFVTVINNCGHMCMLEQPAEFTGALTSFVEACNVLVAHKLQSP